VAQNPFSSLEPDGQDEGWAEWRAAVQRLRQAAMAGGPDGIAAFLQLGDLAQRMLQQLEERADLALWDMGPGDPDAAPLHDLDGIIRPSGRSSVREAVAAWMDQVRRERGSQS
jgi:hypothetical protein